MIDLRGYIRDVPDFPKPGIVFKDITPLLKSPEAFGEMIARLSDPFRNPSITHVAAIESRGFIFGSCVARALSLGFIPIRKPGKLPWTKLRNEYTLEYGVDSLEIHDDALSKGDRVLIIDDVLATGGTAAAAVGLVEMLGAEVEAVAVAIELLFLRGRERLPKVKVHSVLEV